MSTWTNQAQKETLASITYNAPITYSNMNYNYNGKLATVWSTQIKN
jgi:chromosome segregation and condensation protein ScpB